MKKVKGKIIVTETESGVPDLLNASYDLDPEIGEERQFNGERMTVFDVCLRDENTGDLLLIDSTSGRFISIKCSTGYTTLTTKNTKENLFRDQVSDNFLITFTY